MRTWIARLTALVTLAAFEGAIVPSAFAQDADPTAMADAKQHMEAGAALYNDPSGHKCEEAYREFKKAFDLSGSLNALKAMGVCALELERDGDAIDHFEKFLAGKGDKIEPAVKTQVESDLKALRTAVAWITIKANRPGVRVADVRTPSKGFPITNRYDVSTTELRIGVHPGEHVFTASATGATDLEWKLEVANGGTYEHTFELQDVKLATAEPDRSTTAPPGPTERPVPATVYIFGGLTVALAVPTAIFMVGASGKKSDYDAANGKQPAAELETLKSDVSSANLIADVFLGATVASAVATGVFYFTRPTVSPEPPKVGSLSFTPRFSPEGGGAEVSVKF